MIKDVLEAAETAKNLVNSGEEQVSVLEIKKNLDEDEDLKKLDERTKQLVSLYTAKQNRELVRQNKELVRKENIVDGILFVRRNIPAVESALFGIIAALFAAATFFMFQLAILFGILIYLAQPEVYKIIIVFAFLFALIALVIAMVVISVKNAHDSLNEWLHNNNLPPIKYIK